MFAAASRFAGGIDAKHCRNRDARQQGELNKTAFRRIEEALLSTNAPEAQLYLLPVSSQARWRIRGTRPNRELPWVKNVRPSDQRKAGSVLRCRLFTPFEERQQIGVDRGGLRGGHAVGKVLVRLERAIPQ
jgi:hypothetical protein